MPSYRKGFWGRLSASLIAAGLSSAAIADGQAASSAANSIKNPVFGCQQTTTNPNFINYESGQVRPLALSQDGSLLFVANTPANCLEIYSTKGGLRRVSALQVGLEPVAVAVRNQNEIWVVNHLSDSVSVIRIDGTPRIKRTLLVGDEPRDIVFAGEDRQRAFITTAHRGQNHKGFKFEDLRTPGIGRADVWVFDSRKLGRELGGSPETIVSMFADSPRALTVSADGGTVYAAAFMSGNQTTVIAPQIVKGKKPLPHDSHDGVEAPDTSLIVKYNGSAWVDEDGTDWSKHVLFNLPDHDVFQIDAMAKKPSVTRRFDHVGTTLFNMAVNPISGAVYVSNTDARNEVRFEGPGTRSTTLRGHIAENRITVIKNGRVKPMQLNAHVDFNLPMGETVSDADRGRSLAQPTNMVVSDDGSTLMVSAFGSSRVALIDTRRLERGNYQANRNNQIDVPGGPTGLALSPNGKKLYVYSRFDNMVSVINVGKKQVNATVALYNPEPEAVREGRPLLYDADYTSSNGTSSCGSCHIFGDFDQLAWDLGNPDGELIDNNLQLSPGNLLPLKSDKFHPLKGPMTTQTFRGIADSGPMHWRGDRQGLEPAAGETQAEAAFKEFAEAFVGLLGRQHELPEHDLEALTHFSLSITSSPNPIRNLDNSLTPDQAKGKDTYFTLPVDGGISTCDSCHQLDVANKKFGTDTFVSNEGPNIFQDFKVSHLRNLYQKVGMFGTSEFTTEQMGPQIRGFGFLHDGSFANVDDFLTSTDVFVWDNHEQALQVSDYMMVFETERLPIEGQQITVAAKHRNVSLPRLQLLVSQAKLGACRLVASGQVNKLAYYGVLKGDSFYASGFPAFSERKLRRLSKQPGQQITYTCLPPSLANR